MVRVNGFTYLYDFMIFYVNRQTGKTEQRTELMLKVSAICIHLGVLQYGNYTSCASESRFACSMHRAGTPRVPFPQICGQSIMVSW